MENMGILCATFSQAATTRAIGILQGGWIYLLSGKDDGGVMTHKQFFAEFCLDFQMFLCIYIGIKYYQTFPMSNL